MSVHTLLRPDTEIYPKTRHLPDFLFSGTGDLIAEITDYLRDCIEEQYSVGSVLAILPSIRSLAKYLDCSEAELATALDALTEEGYICELDDVVTPVFLYLPFHQ